MFKISIRQLYHLFAQPTVIGLINYIPKPYRFCSSKTLLVYCVCSKEVTYVEKREKNTL